MDKTKRKSLIISYLRDSINIKEFNEEIGMDLPAMSDPLLGAIRSDLRVKSNASLIRDEIIAFDEQQEKSVTSLGRDYIENEKRRLTIEACGYTGLLSDPEIRGIIDKWGTSAEIAALEVPAEEYKNASFTNLLKFLKSHPEYNAEIQEILTEIESENGLSDEIQDFADEVNSNSEGNIQQTAQREELKTFMNETLHTFDTLLQLDDIDEDTIETIRNAAMQSYKIYRDKYSKFMVTLSNDPKVFVQNLYPTAKGLETRKELSSGLQEKFEQIENMIAQLEQKYGNFTQEVDGKAQERPQDESIKDEVGDEFKEKTPEQQKDEEQAQALWMNRLQASDNIVAKSREGAKSKQEVAKLVQDLQQRSTLEKNAQIQEENQNEGQR